MITPTEIYNLFLSYDENKINLENIEAALSYSKDYKIEDFRESFEKQSQKRYGSIGLQEFIFKKECKLFAEKIKEFDKNIKLTHVHHIFSKALGYQNWNTYSAYLKKHK